ncbi:hypothetical protein GGR42_003045 [Saonia flava]|uniref:Uncharacterized protein n=1 Tax=Saonia flava TaxID=523696 RepID=A0A846R599_9FLAO|nr:hypothetical protein [Saonia flava]NJB72554.1 hypothetical protein [Saonia flava]
MKAVELNPPGSFCNWKPSTLEELKNNSIADSFAGANLLFENEYVKLWDITLAPGERLPFSKKNTNYSWTCLSGGQTISHYTDGTIRMYKIEKGETTFFQFKNKHHVSDLENVGKNIVVIHILEYKHEDF